LDGEAMTLLYVHSVMPVEDLHVKRCAALTVSELLWAGTAELLGYQVVHMNLITSFQDYMGRVFFFVFLATIILL